MVSSEFSSFNALRIPGGFFAWRSYSCPCVVLCSLLTVALLPHASKPWPWPPCFLYPLLKHLWLVWCVDLLLASTYPCSSVPPQLSNAAAPRLNSALLRLLWIVTSPQSSQGSGWHSDSLLPRKMW